MELYIQIRDGEPHEHPIAGANFRASFPHIDVENLPADQFARFVRVAPPRVGRFEVYDGATYEWDGDVVTEAHHVRPMTEEEKAALSQPKEK